jgi:RNA polymerase sigma-70 factor (ECF subfamily)
VTTTELIDRARAGDEAAFRELVEPHRRELHVHCYRILGSVQDAEDALQETLIAAWRGLAAFEERASIRTWLYRVATNRCLNALRSARRRPRTEGTMPAFEVPPPSGTAEVLWLEPYADVLLDELPDAEPGPAAVYEAKEAISLAFITALQVLPPRQRAVLVLRDVLGFHAAEVAAMLDASEESVTSALKRARGTLEQRSRTHGAAEPAPPADSPRERATILRLTEAYEAQDIDGIVALLSDDVRIAMPPLPMEYRGRDLCRAFLAAVFTLGRRYRLVATRANGQPALVMYGREPGANVYRALGLLVLTLAGDDIREIVRFENSCLPAFGLPRTLPA